jgi:hypothetical protein
MTFLRVIQGALALGATLAAGAALGAELTVYKSASCGCCNAWITHLERDGFKVKAHNVVDVTPHKVRLGVTPELGSCHTAQIEGYTIEGHVPAADIKRLLKERPKVAGLAVPGMPEGSPGMEGPRPQRYEVLSFDARGETRVFARH